jgi:TatD DNase family protein
MSLPYCVGSDEIGLDCHYDHFPRDSQCSIFRIQFKQAVKPGKLLTIRTHKAAQDTKTTLEEEVPPGRNVLVYLGPRTTRWTCCQIHIHCFIDSADFAPRLLDRFPNLYIDITGLIPIRSSRFP